MLNIRKTKDMKTLYLVRHAKSSWDDLNLSDHERPLSPAGIKKTGKIVNFLKKKNIMPGLMISSSAVRALATAKLIARGIGYPADKIKTDPALYHASEDTILDAVYGLPDDLESVMLFGHNPAFTYFVNYYLTPPLENLPTTGVVSIRFTTHHWENIGNSGFKINFVVFPKMLK